MGSIGNSPDAGHVHDADSSLPAGPAKESKIGGLRTSPDAVEHKVSKSNLPQNSGTIGQVGSEATGEIVFETEHNLLDEHEVMQILNQSESLESIQHKEVTEAVDGLMAAAFKDVYGEDFNLDELAKQTPTYDDGAATGLFDEREFAQGTSLKEMDEYQEMTDLIASETEDNWETDDNMQLDSQPISNIENQEIEAEVQGDLKFREQPKEDEAYTQQLKNIFGTYHDEDEQKTDTNK